jgi:catechol 2,3-dioxygenase
MNNRNGDVPALVFSHFGVFCHDVAALEDFYTRVMGFAVSDCGHVHAGPVEFDMSFMTRRPWEHHQLVIAGGRAASLPSTVNQIGFLSPDLAELRRIKARLEREPGVSDIETADHGIAWTLYFRDPQGNRISASVTTGWYVPQPAYWPLDLSKSDEAIKRATEAQCRAAPGFMTRAAWGAQTYATLADTSRLASQATPTVDAKITSTESVFRRPVGTAAPADPFPKIAMHQVGVYVADLERLQAFYEKTLGYLVTGKGRMPVFGAQPAADMVYLTRDPNQVAQLILVAGRDAALKSSVNQITFRVPDLATLRGINEALRTIPGCANFRPVNHGNSYSLYCDDPEGNALEISYESEYYIPAPIAWPLDFAMDDATLLKHVSDRVHATPGFMPRAEWKARSRAELVASGRIEAEELVEHLY